ncbi:extracellular solute-binding protein [Paraburkholderia xenovorans]|uniref:ABC spermidine/putrescine transporter, periplasmic ligand binding protein n=1 Tax=Paraburkholderia xenovorans (strain LB400) TaxID=266265 RepID=Q13FP4_PARXL|nr:extracellular solute-binding protein [Paraburkholderia xenovorans]ABE37095.1 ABC spermidine/putrescine transporter, periplasmic ligand binding protein [Paraburkholderia xenovorans LB400]
MNTKHIQPAHDLPDAQELTPVLPSKIDGRRRDMLKAAAASLALGPSMIRQVRASTRQIVVGIWGGAQGDFIRKVVIPRFERDYNCSVLAEEGFTLVNVAKMRATLKNPKYTVMFIDDVAVSTCITEKLIAPLPVDRIPNMANLMPRFNYGGYATGVGISIGAMYRNTSTPAPKSFADLWSDTYRDSIKLNSWENTSGIYFLIAAAAVVTSKPLSAAQYEVDKIWAKLRDFKPNVQNIYVSGVEAANEVAQGQAMLGGIDYSKFIYPYAVKGAPIDMVFMKEGSFAGVNCQVLVANGPNQDLGVAFINRMLSADVQKALAEFSLVAPPVRGVTLTPQTLRYVAYPEQRMDQLGLFIPDWKFVNQNRAKWTEKTNEIFTA